LLKQGEKIMTITAVSIASLRQLLLPTIAAMSLAGGVAQAQIAVSSNDSKIFLNADGVIQLTPNVKPDTATVLDLAASPPRIIAEIDDVPGSVVGPPSTLAISPDNRLVVVASSMKRDPTNPSKMVFDDRLTVIDLTAKPPRVIDRLQAGQQATGVAFSPRGDIVLVANRGEGTISQFAVDGQKLTPIGKLSLGNEKSQPSAIEFTPDGLHVLLTRSGDGLITILDVDGRNLTISPRVLGPTQAPYCLAVNPNGRMAVVGSLGYRNGDHMDAATISTIDLTVRPIRVVGAYSVPPVVENVVISPDGRYVAAISHNGSGASVNHPNFHDRGVVTAFRVNGTALQQIGALPMGRWGQGAVFSKDNALLVESAYDKTVGVYRIKNDKLLDTGVRLQFADAPVALVTARFPH
jgi:DNA-binding beta-propeller fold protein YncE